MDDRPSVVLAVVVRPDVARHQPVVVPTVVDAIHQRGAEVAHLANGDDLLDIGVPAAVQLDKVALVERVQVVEDRPAGVAGVRRDEGVILPPGVGHGSTAAHGDSSCLEAHRLDPELVQPQSRDGYPKASDGSGSRRNRRQAFGMTTLGRPLWGGFGQRGPTTSRSST